MRDNYPSIESLPFKPPPPELLALMHWACECYRDFERACGIGISDTQLYGFGELMPLQVDRLLSL